MNDEFERMSDEPMSAGDLEQLQQEDDLFPWLADGSMADPSEELWEP